MDSARTRWFIPLVLAIAAIMIATLVLGYYGYHAASRMVAKSEESLEKSNRVVGQKLIDRIERTIIDTDRTLFQMVRLEDPLEFRELWQRIVRTSPLVETVIVLDEDLDVVHLVSHLGRSPLQEFNKIFFQRIVRVMDLPLLRPNAHRHLHRNLEGKDYLISYIRRRQAGREYFIALNINLRHIIHEILKEEFQELEESKFIAILGEARQVVYGRPTSETGALVFEGRFPTTLYRWRLHIASKEVRALRRQARTRRILNLALVGTADGLLLLGMLTLLIAVRKERRANALKNEFISNVTHELKTPLSLIRMFGELLALGRTASPDTAREYAEIITRESDRLTRLIDNVLDFANIERGRAAYDFEQGHLATVVERAVDLVRYRADQHGVVVSTEVAPDLPRVMLNEDAMILLLLNLLENALKYGVEGDQGELTVSLRRAGEALSLQVADQGPGIPQEEVGRIFARFFRGKAARARSSRGSGIGLSLVQHIARSHGGDVTVKSILGKGTVFEVTIPLMNETDTATERG